MERAPVMRRISEAGATKNEAAKPEAPFEASS
jgi:hypothetical protein